MSSSSDPLLDPGSFIAADHDGTTTDDVHETPSWLPEGWTMTTSVRKSGATKGSIDRYYFEPNSENRFRSRKEVEYYLETGSKRKKNDAAADVQPSESPAGSKKKKSGSSSKNSRPTPPRPLKFDFNNVPEMTTWKLTDAANDQWTPFIDGKMVSKSVKQDWEAAFKSLTSGN